MARTSSQLISVAEQDPEIDRQPNHCFRERFGLAVDSTEHESYSMSLEHYSSSLNMGETPTATRPGSPAPQEGPHQKRMEQSS